MIAAKYISGDALATATLKGLRMIGTFLKKCGQMIRKIQDQNAEQALAHTRIKAELEDRRARCLFDRGGLR